MHINETAPALWQKSLSHPLLEAANPTQLLRKGWGPRHIIHSFVAVCLLTLAAHARDSSLVITHVTVIDTKTGQSQPNMDVLIRGNRIAEIEKANSEHWNGVTVLDGSGKFLIPGLWDMEVHLSWTTASALPLLVANGITNVRDMGSDLVQIEHWRTLVSAGLLVGPNILRVGPMLNGESFNQYQMVLGPPEQAKGVVRTLKFLSMDGLELERRVSRDSYFALMKEAQRERIPVGGHIPLTVTPEEASDAGQATIDNIETLFEGEISQTPKEKVLTVIPRFLSSDADRVFQRFLKNHTAVTPAIATFESSLQGANPSAPKDPRNRYVAKSLRNFWEEHPTPPDKLKIQQKIFPQLVQVVRRLNTDGVMLLAGTDLAGPRIPGFSLHNEISMLVKAGLTPLQALQTATWNPALALGRTNDFGSIDLGKYANLVVLNANPLEDISNLEGIFAVILNGKLFRRSDLDALLREGQRLANQN